MNRPSKSSKIRSLKAPSSAARKRPTNASGVPQLFLGHKIIGELKILARLASKREHPNKQLLSKLARLKKAA